MPEFVDKLVGFAWSMGKLIERSGFCIKNFVILFFNVNVLLDYYKYTVCPIGLVQFYIVTHYIKMDKTSWTYRKVRYFMAIVIYIFFIANCILNNSHLFEK